MRSWMWGLMVVVLCVSLSGCETVKGVGRDISGAADSVQKGLSGHK